MTRPLQMSFIMMTSMPRRARMSPFSDANVDSGVASSERASPSIVRTCMRGVSFRRPQILLAQFYFETKLVMGSTIHGSFMLFNNLNLPHATLALA
jgi:hypothetical protein